MWITKTVIRGCEAHGDADSAYLTRYSLPRLGPIRLNLHVFHRSDSDEQHDHPWRFLTLILWRGYVEETPAGRSRKWPGMVLYRSATHRHRVELVDGKRAVTLVAMGVRTREWGFFTAKGWQRWAGYFRERGCR